MHFFTARQPVDTIIRCFRYAEREIGWCQTSFWGNHTHYSLKSGNLHCKMRYGSPVENTNNNNEKTLFNYAVRYGRGHDSDEPHDDVGKRHTVFCVIPSYHHRYIQRHPSGYGDRQWHIRLSEQQICGDIPNNVTSIGDYAFEHTPARWQTSGVPLVK